MSTGNVITDKSYGFALNIVACYKQLAEVYREFILSKQLLRSGTCIGANVSEAINSESKPDFIHKMGIALKESNETNYWLRLLSDSGFLEKTAFEKLHKECTEINKILKSIILTARANMQSEKGRNSTKNLK